MPARPRHEMIDCIADEAHPPHDGPAPGGPAHAAGARRRRFGAVLVAAGLLTAIGATVAWATPDEAGTRPSGATRTEETRTDDPPTPVDPGDLTLTRFEALSIEFADRHHGFSLTTTCPDGKQPCSYGLAVTTDGGRSYQHRALPLAKVRPVTDGYSATLHAVTAQTVVIEDRGQWWVSLDSGRTWRSAPDRVARDAAGIPAGGRLHTTCADVNCDIHEIGVIEPDTGTRSALPNVPLNWVADSSMSTVAPDGTRWISGTAKGGDPALATTRDGGRTWSVSRFVKPDKLLFGPKLVVGPGNLRYAVFTVQREHVKNGFGPMYRSTDAGRTWVRVRHGETQPASILGAIVRPDGRLLIGTERDGPMISADGGRTFTRLGALPRLATIAERSGRIMALGEDGAHHTSVDGGMTWSPISVPAP